MQVFDESAVLVKIAAPLLCSFSTRRQKVFRFPVIDVIKVNKLVELLKRGTEE